MAAASAEKKRIVSRVFRAGSGLSLTSLPVARGEALPLRFSDGGMLREEAAPAPSRRVFWRWQTPRARVDDEIRRFFSLNFLVFL
jgi:hypothetical protein